MGYVVGLAVLLRVVLAPAASWNSGSADASREATSIKSYLATFDLAKNGDLSVVETLAVDFQGSGKHGIFRFWDRADDSAPQARRTPHDIAVTIDDSPVPSDLIGQYHGRSACANTGSAPTPADPAVPTPAPRPHPFRHACALAHLRQPRPGASCPRPPAAARGLRAHRSGGAALAARSLVAGVDDV